MDNKIITIDNIFNYLPHRYPFLLVDRVLDYTSNSIKAIKNVTINEPFFVGHFPIKPVMPGVLIVEGMAQAAAILAYVSTGTDPKKSLFYLGSIDNTRFRKVVSPGDTLVYEIEITKRRHSIWKFTAKALVEGEVVCEAEMTSAEGKVVQ